MAIDAHAAAPGRIIHFDPARAGTEIVEGIFCIDPAFDGVSAKLNVALGDAQRFAHGNHDLLLHQIDAGDFLGDGMFHLNPFVHFQEIKVPVSHRR